MTDKKVKEDTPRERRRRRRDRLKKARELKNKKAAKLPISALKEGQAKPSKVGVQKTTEQKKTDRNG